MEKAILTAKHPKDSKFGECLLNTNTKEDPILDSKLNKIRGEMKRMKSQVNQMREHFVRKSHALNYEPMILVERPPSGGYKSISAKDSITDQGLPIEELEKPGYMRQLKSRCKTPVRHTTIDAFTLRVKRKQNVWEECEDNKNVIFTSTIRPYSRLTDDEIGDLQHGWNHHKPKLISEDGKTISIAPLSKRK
ncbi:hypothetical protein SNE40_018866 [Patella caerulea]